MTPNQTPVFILDWIYKAVQNKNFDLDKTLKIINATEFGVYELSDIKKSPLSVRTLYELAFLNTVCQNLVSKSAWLDKTRHVENGFKGLLSTDMVKDCNQNVSTALLEQDDNDRVVAWDGEEAKPETYYELQITQDGLLIVVVKNGFLNHLVETKDNYLQFVLKCLELAYNRSSTVSDPIVNTLLSTYLHYSSAENYDATFRAKALACLS